MVIRIDSITAFFYRALAVTVLMLHIAVMSTVKRDRNFSYIRVTGINELLERQYRSASINQLVIFHLTSIIQSVVLHVERDE